MKKILLLLTVAFITTNFSAQIITFTHEDSLKFEYRLFKGSGTYTSISEEKSAGNSCASAVTLTPGAALLCSNTVGDNLQAGETAPPCSGFGGGGVTDRTTWFRFTATNTQMVLDYMSTIATNCATACAVYGPFLPGTGCLPTAGQSVFCKNLIGAGDPGDHNLVTGLVVGSSYLIQILNKDCGGGNSGTASFCLGISNVASNNAPGAPTVINACGSAFNGTNALGYYPSGTGTSLSNLDGNAGTTCSTCAAGNDVPFVVNNDSWFSFCSANAGQWQINFTVGTCFQSAPNNGLQMAILTGTSTNLTNLQNAPNPTAPGASWTSGTITLAAGACAYLVVDGFAGDQCSYSYTLTNLTGGCVLLPVELISFNVQRFERQSFLKWIIESERNNSYFKVERSIDGVSWETVHTENSIGDHQNQTDYTYLDDNSSIPSDVTIYYRLSQHDLNGNEEIIAISASKGIQEHSGLVLNIVPNPVSSNDNISVSIDADYETFAEIRLKDIQGKTIATELVSIVKGANIVVFQAEELNNGVYFIEYDSKEESKAVKLIKL